MQSSASNDEPAESKLLARISWRLMPFLLVLYIVSYLDRINLSFAALQMNEQLKFSDGIFSFGAGIFFIGYCAFGIPSNVVIKKLGPRLWISSIMVTWGFVTLAMILVRDELTFYFLRFALGAAEAGFFPGMLLYLTYWFPPKQYGSAVARFMSAIPLAGLLGSFVAARAFELNNLAGLAGWQWMFIVTGLPAVLLGVLVFFVLPDRPHQARWLSPAEKDLHEGLMARAATKIISATQAPEQLLPPDGGTPTATISVLSTLKSAAVWHFALLYFSTTVCMYGFQLWLPQIIKAFCAGGGSLNSAGTNTTVLNTVSNSVSNSTVALLSAIPAAMQALGMLFIAASSDKSGERMMHIIGSSVITGLGCVAAALLPDQFKLAGLSIAAFGIWGVVGPFWALTRASLSQQAQPAGIAFINSVGNLGGFVGPMLIGAIKQFTGAKGDAEFTSALLLLAVTAVLTIVLAAFSGRYKQQ